MKEREVEDLLRRLPGVYDKVNRLRFTATMREQVLKKARLGPREGIGKSPRPWKLLAAAAVFLAVISGAFLLWPGGSGPPQPAFTQVESVLVDLDGSGSREMVNTWMVRHLELPESLMALVWARDGDGRWQVVSTHAVKGYQFLPLKVLHVSEYEGELVVVSAEEGSDRISYLVLGYDGEKVKIIDEAEALLPELWKEGR